MIQGSSATPATVVLVFRGIEGREHFVNFTYFARGHDHGRGTRKDLEEDEDEEGWVSTIRAKAKIMQSSFRCLKTRLTAKARVTSSKDETFPPHKHRGTANRSQGRRDPRDAYLIVAQYLGLACCWLASNLLGLFLVLSAAAAAAAAPAS